MSRCSVCQMPPEKLAAIDAGIRAQIPLGQLAASAGLSKSTLSRHGQHMGQSVASGEVVPVPAAPAGAQEAKTAVRAPAPVGIQQSAPVAPVQVTVGPTKEVLLGRIEHLWEESLDGLEAAKETIKVRRPDGGEMELPGDLRARAGFLREARGVVELAGMATGHFQRGDAGGGTNVAIQIVCPAGSCTASADVDDGGVTIDIGPGSGGR